jgi:phenylalanyl-tRNA synthetase beta chain
MSWLHDYVDLQTTDPRQVAGRLTEAGLKVERVEETGADISGVVVAQVLAVEELSGFKKPIRWVTLTDGSSEHQVICGATNFDVGDTVAYARPPAVLPGGFRVDKRPAYGHDSDGMICSARELALGDDHTGILVLGKGDQPDLPLGADVVEVLGLRDTVLELSINPDRGYALSVRGIARELATAYGAPFRDPADLGDRAGGPAGDATAAAYDVRIDDRDGCDRYVARLVTDLDPDASSPRWLQRRLTLAGMRPISLAVDVTNHVMLELGQPLHAFDRAKLTGPIVVRRAVAGEHLRTLDDVDRALDPTDLLICDDSGPIALAGVMGGAATEIGAATTDVVLESAHFDPVSIAYTARRHRLGSEASRRFERGVDDALQPAAAAAAGRLLEQLGRATVAAAITDVDLRRPRPVITLDPSLPGRLAGVPYAEATVRARLHDVGCAVDSEPGDPLQVTPPSWRPDLRVPVDLVEEVVRLEGYARLPSTVPAAPAGRGLTRQQRQRRQVGRALSAAGFVEVLAYPFVAGSTAEALMLDPADPRRPSVRLANPVSAEEPFLRSTLLPGLLVALGRNVGRGFADTALFETGSVFRAAPPGAVMPHPPAGRRPADGALAAMEAALPAQPLHVAVALAGHWERPGWWGPGRLAGWADAVEAARTSAGALGVALEVAAAEQAPWHPGRCARLSVAGTIVGHAGELHPRVVEAFDLPARSCAMELELAPLLAAAPEIVPAPIVSAYPPATLDVALVVPIEVPAATVETALRDGAGPLLESLRLFDLYTGDPVPPGHRSLAYNLRLRAPDRTLTADEAIAIRDSAVAAAASRCGAVLRT